MYHPNDAAVGNLLDAVTEFYARQPADRVTADLRGLLHTALSTAWDEGYDAAEDEAGCCNCPHVDRSMRDPAAALPALEALHGALHGDRFAVRMCTDQDCRTVEAMLRAMSDTMALA